MMPIEISAPATVQQLVPSEATFRLPSTPLFLGLMPVFSGLARRADLATLVAESGSINDGPLRERGTQVRTYIIHNGRESQARTSLTLFEDDPLWNEGELSSLIKRQFGPAGLKHLLGVMIAAEEQAGRDSPTPGSFVFDSSRHLDILGYTRSNKVKGKGYHTAKHLREAREIVTLLCSLTIVQEIRLGTRRGATLKIRLLLDDASAESWEETVADGETIKERIVTNEKIYLRFNPYLFSAAAEGTTQIQHLYTHQLKKLARESARTHGLTLTLGAHLPIKFRLNGCQPLRLAARAFLRMAGIVEDEYTRYEHLERMENTLRHMVEQGYLGSFETERYRYIAEPNAETASLRDRADGALRRRSRLELKGNGAVRHPEPLEEVWEVEPPDFLRSLLPTAESAARVLQADLKSLARLSGPKSARDAQQELLPGLDVGGPPPQPGELLKQVRLGLKLQQAELAKRLGITQAAVSMAEAGKRPRMAARLLDLARRMGAEN